MLEPVLRIRSNQEIEMFTAVCLMTGGATNYGKSKDSLLPLSCNVFGKWLSNQIVAKEEFDIQAKEEFDIQAK